MMKQAKDYNSVIDGTLSAAIDLIAVLSLDATYQSSDISKRVAMHDMARMGRKLVNMTLFDMLYITISHNGRIVTYPNLMALNKFKGEDETVAAIMEVSIGQNEIDGCYDIYHASVLWTDTDERN